MDGSDFDVGWSLFSDVDIDETLCVSSCSDCRFESDGGLISSLSLILFVCFLSSLYRRYDCV